MKFKPYLISAISFLLFISCNQTNNSNEYIKIQGSTQGTYYSVLYQNSVNKNLQPQIDSILHAFDLIFSNYISNSTISRINNNDTTIVVNNEFIYFWNTSYHIWKITDGNFDISIAPIINAWKFGYKNNTSIPTKYEIDSLLKIKGMDKMYIANHKFIKQNSRLQIIGNAIAQGYSVDIICAFLDSLHISNYLVDVGGEMKAKGKNSKNKIWTIGITKPQEKVDTLAEEDSYELTCKLNHKALATSGNYRKFYVVNGKKYSHTINPHNGYPVTSNLLSATVLADKCIEADAIATACMVMGLEKSIAFFNKNLKYDAILLYKNQDSIQVYKTKKIRY